MYLDELNDDALAFIHERAMARPDPSVLIHVPIMGGATAAVGADDTAFGDRSAPFMLSIDGGTYDSAKFDEVRDWVRASIEMARQLDGAGGAYLSFSGDAGADERVLQQQFGDNLEPAEGDQDAVRPRQPLPRQQQHQAGVKSGG